jgi:hypothetical protein
MKESLGTDLGGELSEFAQQQDSIFGLTDEELHSNAPFNIRWREQNPLSGFHVYLAGQVLGLNDNLRIAVITELDKVGWPLHLRSMEAANWTLIPGSPWPKEDEAPLVLLRRMFKLPSTSIADVFFEGRTARECEEKLYEIMGDQYEQGAGLKPETQNMVDWLARNDWGQFIKEEDNDESPQMQDPCGKPGVPFPLLRIPTSIKPFFEISSKQSECTSTCRCYALWHP